MRATRPTSSPSLLLRSLFAVALLALAVAASPALAAEGEAQAEEKPVLTLEAITVTPDKPAADTLCQLTVRIRNAGDKPVSGLGFEVKVAGNPLTVYGNQLFYQLLPAGEATDVPLFNFWTSESLRPAPADGKLPVEVTLQEATWMEVSTDKDGVEVWKVLEAVGGLPVSKTLPLTLAGMAKPAESGR